MSQIYALPSLVPEVSNDCFDFLASHLQDETSNNSSSAGVIRGMTRGRDLKSSSIPELESLLDPLARKHPELQEYIRRSRLMSQTRGPLTQSLLELQSVTSFFVVDLEATCFSDLDYQGPHDVIEIGAVLFDCVSLKEIDRVQWYTKPSVTEVSHFCTSLTGIEPKTVENAPTFKQRIQELDRYIHENKLEVWGSYGGYDRNQFSRQCEREGLTNPMDRLEHVNIKELVGTHLGFKKKQPGLRRAMDLVGLQIEGTLHSGADDARNISRLFQKILIENGIVQPLKKSVNLRC